MTSPWWFYEAAAEGALGASAKRVVALATGRPADLLFLIRGRKMGEGRVRKGLARAVELAGVTDQQGRPLHVTPHQLRHTYGTSLINGEMSLQALMALLGHVTPDRIQWLHSEMLKTRLSGGYCARHSAAGPCPYANVCEQCDYFTPGEEFTSALGAQLADVIALRDDARERGWANEADRHARVIESLQGHLDRLQ